MILLENYILFIDLYSIFSGHLCDKVVNSLRYKSLYDRGISFFR